MIVRAETFSEHQCVVVASPECVQLKTFSRWEWNSSPRMERRSMWLVWTKQFVASLKRRSLSPNCSDSKSLKAVFGLKNNGSWGKKYIYSFQLQMSRCKRILFLTEHFGNTQKEWENKQIWPVTSWGGRTLEQRAPAASWWCLGGSLPDYSSPSQTRWRGARHHTAARNPMTSIPAPSRRSSSLNSNCTVIEASLNIWQGSFWFKSVYNWSFSLKMLARRLCCSRKATSP